MKFTRCNLSFNFVLFQRVYDEEVEETVPKAEASEKKPQQVR